MNPTKINQALWEIAKNRLAAVDPIEIIGTLIVEIEGRPMSQKDRDNAVKIHRKITSQLEQKCKIREGL